MFADASRDEHSRRTRAATGSLTPPSQTGPALTTTVSRHDAERALHLMRRLRMVKIARHGRAGRRTWTVRVRNRDEWKWSAHVRVAGNPPEPLGAWLTALQVEYALTPG